MCGGCLTTQPQRTTLHSNRRSFQTSNREETERRGDVFLWDYSFREMSTCAFQIKVSRDVSTSGAQTNVRVLEHFIMFDTQFV